MPSIDKPKGRLRRALKALPMLGLSAIMARAVTMSEPIAPVLEGIVERGHFDLGGVSAPIITEFYGVPLLDQIFTQITTAFAQLQFYSDPLLYWQSLVFLTDYAGMYAILLFEASRVSPKAALFQYPAVFAMLAQMIPIGLLSPIFFYIYYVLTPTEQPKGANSRLFDKACASAVLPTVVLAYFIPHFFCYFHPSLEARNWWNWVWQLYPVWGAAVLYVFSRLYAHQRELRVVRATVAILAIVSTVVYWYSLSTSNLPFLEIFAPDYLIQSPDSAELALRTIIQYDFICTFAAGYLWLALHFWDLKASGVQVSLVRLSGASFIVGSVFGPGPLLLFVWIWREEFLASDKSSSDITLVKIAEKSE